MFKFVTLLALASLAVAEGIKNCESVQDCTDNYASYAYDCCFTWVDSEGEVNSGCGYESYSATYASYLGTEDYNCESS